jgi:hypothetical protein
VKLVGEFVIVTATVAGAIVHTVKLEPAYEPDPLEESTTSVVKVPETGGEVAAEVGPVSVPNCSVVVKPGGKPVPDPSVHCTALDEVAPTVARLVPHVAEPEKDHPEGAITVKEVSAYALLAGLVTFTAKVVPGLPPIITLGTPNVAGGLPFAVGLLMTAFVTALPVEANAGRNAKALPTSRKATTRTDSLVVSLV